MKKHFKIFLTFLLFTISTSLFAENDINLIRLDGKWELFLKKTPEQTFTLIDKKQPADFMCEVPGDWNKEIKAFDHFSHTNKIYDINELIKKAREQRICNFHE